MVFEADGSCYTRKDQDKNVKGEVDFMSTVSVIMPVYNAQDVLSRSLGQLAAQTLENMEFVIVDDCSTDHSYDKLRRFREKYPEQVVLLQTPQNAGPGGARNIGLRQASGEYIGFVDADDEIVPDMFQKLYEKAMETDADIVDSGYYNEKLDYAMLHTSDDLCGMLDGYKRSQLIVSGGYIVTKIFRREFLEKQQMFFREKVSLEDSEFITKAFATADTVANIKEILYKYTFTDYSASRERDAKQYFTNVVEAMKANYNAVYELSYYEEIKQAVEYLIIQLYSFGVLKCLSVCTEQNRQNVVEHLQYIREVREESVSENYEDNAYIQQKIGSDDIQIMKLNDQSPEKLVQIILESQQLSN